MKRILLLLLCLLLLTSFLSLGIDAKIMADLSLSNQKEVEKLYDEGYSWDRIGLNMIKLPHGKGSIHAKISGYYS